ncbi:hypothetical protein [Alteromonas sp. a30]|uniref:hypothetical protein n=1 Tax=Alteromonas sp. a30 TaxID=2730917 RepID=UPI00227E68E0|nr:hypothetical protein [Alteromonas sp. a30]MCY7294571.1 hypothetical protein [Alteromonas sp. a30]
MQCVAELKAEFGDENIVVPDADKFLSPEDRFDNGDTSGDGLLIFEEVLAATTEKTTEAS